MREILFRGKRVDNGEWVEGCGFADEGYFGKLFFPHDTLANAAGTEYFFYDNVQVYTNTVGQYTGLQDKNGNKIFEGDIVKIPTENPMLAKVICPIGDGVLYEIIKADDHIYHKLRLRRSDFHVSEYDFYKKCIEVIGNIFDNPELWEENND